ncbi:hypothetical protein H5185_20035 [Shewanella sp. SG44-6]|uniref:DUF6731 family protein n=1 Tax=Shewanella sp. SG44-6 TaxID=2760959 RepID=UPI0016039360|nr:DUF6731 family protein [Shewanella sp. SG44-6]MBB1391680.1 hypothetical protein [Shewanella sp. SG44-6]
MSSKNYHFDFYECSIFNSSANAIPRTSFEILNSMLAKYAQGDSRVKQIGNNSYELRHLEATAFGFKGIIGKHRQNDLPHAAVIGGVEREIELAANENLLEKAYFSYHSDYSVLILQRNHLCISSSSMGKYLSESAYVTSLNPVIEAADLQWLLNNNVQVRTAELSIARPTNPELFNGIEHDFNNSIISTLKGTGAAKLNLTLRGNGRSDIAEERYLATTFKGALRELNTKFDVKKCKLLLEDDETLATHPVDLVADRLFFTKQIEVEGRYPPIIEMWDALNESRAEKENELANYFGDLNQERLA